MHSFPLAVPTHRVLHSATISAALRADDVTLVHSHQIQCLHELHLLLKARYEQNYAKAELSPQVY